MHDAALLAAFTFVLLRRAHAARQMELLQLPVKMVGWRTVATVKHHRNGNDVPLTTSACS